MKANPTEYKGVRYRSKCEAQFALWLHWVHRSFDAHILLDEERKSRITQDGCTGFEYEPKLPCELQCDFMTWRTELCEGSVVPKLVMTFIEYKPSRPTQTYVENWAKKVRKCQAEMEAINHKPDRVQFFIYYGSAYESNCGILRIEGSDDIREVDNDWCAQIRGDMLAYRFDLQQKAGS